MQYINIPAGTTYPLILGDEASAMNTAKIYLLCDTSSGAGAINILLPRITNGDSSLKNWWFEIFINDIGNNASVNNIKITPNPADKINGSGAQITLSTNGVTGRIVVTSKTGWDFNIGSSSSGGVADGWIFAGTFTYLQWKNSLNQPDAQTSIIDLATIPANEVIEGVAVRGDAQFITNSGGIFLGYIGNTTTGSKTVLDMVSIVSNATLVARTQWRMGGNGNSADSYSDLSGSWILQGKLTTDSEAGGTIANLSQGQVEIWYKKAPLP